MASLAINVLVAARSVDGMAGSAAFIRQSQNHNIQLIFTQAFQVDTIDVSKWPPNRQVGFIDLAVNNAGTSPNPQITIDFVSSLYKAGHTIRFIADGHGKQAWKDVLEECGHPTKGLCIMPRENFTSSCAILKELYAEAADSHTKALLEAGHEADKMNFNTFFGRIFNEFTKSNMTDSTRCSYAVQHLAFNDTADSKIEGWMQEYREMQRNLLKILASGQDLGDGIYSYDCTIGRHDATAIFNEAYEISSMVVLKGTNVFLEGKSQDGISIATNKKDLNVLKIILQAGITASGMAAKANLALKDQDAAIEAVRKAVKG